MSVVSLTGKNILEMTGNIDLNTHNAIRSCQLVEWQVAISGSAGNDVTSELTGKVGYRRFKESYRYFWHRYLIPTGNVSCYFLRKSNMTTYPPVRDFTVLSVWISY